ncbi:MAG: hypothetical protein IPF79_05250 [Ignavibacteria bacterium]|nr:hypothetical protein [Ignavibacteria bacterium]
MTGTSSQITYSNELARKGIHLASLLIPIIYLQVEHWTGIGILVSMTAVSILIDSLMHFHEPTRRVMLDAVGSLMRTHELRRDRFHLTGASWVLIAATSTFLVFPSIIGVTAFTVLIVSDTFAALIGRRYGVRPFIDKSVVGTITFVCTAMIVVVVYGLIFSLPWTFYAVGLVSSIASGVAEAASTRLHLDDNISTPFSFAITMWVLGAILVATGLPNFIHALP